MTDPGFNADWTDFLTALVAARVEFLIVGAHALAFHGQPRSTGDLDILVRPERANAERLMEALRRFGAPVAAHGVSVDDFCKGGAVYQLGRPPRRIDVLTAISGVDFDQAWASRASAVLGGVAVNLLGRDALIENKRAVGRDKDLLDVKMLENAKAK
jgi:hypothetical protein